MTVLDLDTIGLGYTLGTGRLYCDFAEFQKFAERILDRPILTHEFGSENVWNELRICYEDMVVEAMK